MVIKSKLPGVVTIKAKDIVQSKFNLSASGYYLDACRCFIPLEGDSQVLRDICIKRRNYTVRGYFEETMAWILHD